MTYFLNSSKDCKKKCNRTEYIPGPQGPQGPAGPSGSTNYISGITNFSTSLGSTSVSIPAPGLTVNSPVLLTFYTIPTAGTSSLIIPKTSTSIIAPVSITKDIANSQVVITFTPAFLAQIAAINGISINYFIGGLIPPLAN